jgi:uncharacterized protein YndB with AHSA1/START domain
MTLTSAAAPERVFAALTDPEQVTAWWNAKSTTGSGEAGGELRITFGTEEQSTVMRVLAARRPDVVAWEVTSSPLVPDSAGTRPTFTMTAAGDSAAWTSPSTAWSLSWSVSSCATSTGAGAPGYPRRAARLNRDQYRTAYHVNRQSPRWSGSQGAVSANRSWRKRCSGSV